MRTIKFDIKETVILCFSLILIGLNLTGLVHSLRNPDLLAMFPEDISLPPPAVTAAFHKSYASVGESLNSMNEAVYLGVAHVWSDEYTKTLNIEIPIYENYILFGAKYLYPRVYRKYEFTDYHRALERGVGLCSQHAIIMAGGLSEIGVPAKIYALTGHVVALAWNKETEEWWVCDSDLGVVIPMDIGKIEMNPELVRSSYMEKGFSGEELENIIGVYDKSGNGKYFGKFYELKIFLEQASYIMIWIIPFGLIYLTVWRKGTREHNQITK